MDEAEGLVDGSASVCSSSSGRIEPPTREQQLNLCSTPATASEPYSGTVTKGFYTCFTSLLVLNRLATQY